MDCGCLNLSKRDVLWRLLDGLIGEEPAALCNGVLCFTRTSVDGDDRFSGEWACDTTRSNASGFAVYSRAVYIAETDETKFFAFFGPTGAPLKWWFGIVPDDPHTPVNTEEHTVLLAQSDTLLGGWVTLPPNPADLNPPYIDGNLASGACAPSNSICFARSDESSDSRYDGAYAYDAERSYVYGRDVYVKVLPAGTLPLLFGFYGSDVDGWTFGILGSVGSPLGGPGPVFGTAASLTGSWSLNWTGWPPIAGEVSTCVG